MNRTSVLFIIMFILYERGCECLDPKYSDFDDEFSFGVATSSYQVEGAWNVSGKGFGYWDYLTHDLNITEDGSTGDIACDSYNNVEEDIQLLKMLGVDQYRFSLSWSRILPTGQTNNINWKAVAYYNKLINRLIEENIKPMITIYHFDHPYAIHQMGGWLQPKMADYLAEYADLLFHLYGDRVTEWFTINEPYSMCVNSLQALQPALMNGSTEYICGRNVLIAHAAIYNLYKSKYANQGGKIGMILNLQGHLPATNDSADIAAVERVRQFAFGWFAHPQVYGNYPPDMIDIVDRYSKEQGYQSSRLPKFTDDELEAIKGSYDFIGLNNYDTFLVTSDNGTIDTNPSYANDYGAALVDYPGSDMSETIQGKVLGFGNILKWIKDTYKNPEIHITEQGLPDDTGTIADDDRETYLVSSLNQLLKSKTEDGVNITAYTFWSFLDNFEWIRGYTIKFGLIHVDFNGPERKRTPKKSAKTFASITRNKSLKGFL